MRQDTDESFVFFSVRILPAVISLLKFSLKSIELINVLNYFQLNYFLVAFNFKLLINRFHHSLNLKMIKTIEKRK